MEEVEAPAIGLSSLANALNNIAVSTPEITYKTTGKVRLSSDAVYPTRFRTCTDNTVYNRGWYISTDKKYIILTFGGKMPLNTLYYPVEYIYGNMNFAKSTTNIHYATFYIRTDKFSLFIRSIPPHD